MRHPMLGFSNAALLIAASNFAFWLVFLFPVYATTDGGSNSEGLRILILFFIGADFVGLAFAGTAIYKSKLRKTMANYGFIFNIAMIGLNLSVFPH